MSGFLASALITLAGLIVGLLIVHFTAVHERGSQHKR